MKNLLFLLSVIITLFCGQSKAEVNCGDKFPSATIDPSTTFEDLPKQSAKLLCSKLGSKNQSRNGNNERSVNCIGQHTQYFETANADTQAIEKYTKFCRDYRMEGSCYYPENSINLLNRLKSFCWTLSEIADSNENVFNKNVQITPEDWKNLYDVDNINLASCFDQISSEESTLASDEDDKENLKYKNLGVLKEYKESLKNKKSYCNCVEVLGLNQIFENSGSIEEEEEEGGHHLEKSAFLEEVCIKSNKKNFWKKEQLEAIKEFVKNSQTVQYYYVNIRKISEFLVIGEALASKKWYSSDPQYKNSNWPVSYVLDTSLIDKTTFDRTRIDTMAKAIYYGYSMELFNQFLAITFLMSDNKPGPAFNIWECRKDIIDAFFNYEREEKINEFNVDNLHYNKETTAYANLHLKLFLKLRQPKRTCRELTILIDKIMTVYYSYRCKMSPANYTRVLQAALHSRKNLEDTYKCLAFANSAEKLIVQKSLLKTPNQANNSGYQETKLAEFRLKIFSKAENFELCSDYAKLEVDTLSKILRRLYTRGELANLFQIPLDE